MIENIQGQSPRMNVAGASRDLTRDLLITSLSHRGQQVSDEMTKFCHQGRVDQSVVSLTSLLMVKILTVLISTISNSQVFLLKKCE